MPKRGNLEGSIRFRKDKRWEGRYLVGYSTDGKAIRRSVYGSTQLEVQSRLREVLRQLERGEYIQPNNMTVSQWMDIWFNTYGLPRWRAKTAEVHSDSIRLHIKPILGKIVLSKLRTDHIQAFINEQQRRGFSSGSIHKRIEPLKGAFKQAVDNQLLLRNPADKVKMPQKDSKEIDFLSLEEQKILLPYLLDTTAGRALRFILNTGLRVSELCGLRWSDIEEDSFTIRMNAQYVRNNGAGKGEIKQTLCITPPKTKAGRRKIPITVNMKALLEAQRKAQLAARLLAGTAWVGGSAGSGTCPVFSTDIGTVSDRNNIARALRTYLKNAGLKSRGVHALRHTFATNWVRTGGDLRTLSEILGHTKVSFTLQLYVHTDMNIKLAGMEAVENLL